MHPPHPGACRQLACPFGGATWPQEALQRARRGGARVRTTVLEVISHMHGTFGEPIPLHCPCGPPPGATTVLGNTFVHRRCLPRGEVGARPPFRIDVKRRAPTPLASGDLRALLQRAGGSAVSGVPGRVHGGQARDAGKSAKRRASEAPGAGAGRSSDGGKRARSQQPRLSFNPPPNRTERRRPQPDPGAQEAADLAEALARSREDF